ncbi:MAG: hypothetical protein LBT42_01030 [Tannerella sp.]|jgi:hypothetical protein|nr:hypothetical protein [Tannerella sp.]
MRKSISTGRITALLVVTCMLFGSISATGQVQATSNVYTQTAPQSDRQNVSACVNLAEFLKKEFAVNSKPGKDENTQIVGVQENNAIPEALKLCGKLKAKRISADNDDLVYELPDGLGRMTVHEVYKDNLHLELYFDTQCNGLPFTKVRYVSLSFYNRQ